VGKETAGYRTVLALDLILYTYHETDSFSPPPPGIVVGVGEWAIYYSATGLQHGMLTFHHFTRALCNNREKRGFFFAWKCRGEDCVGIFILFGLIGSGMCVYGYRRLSHWKGGGVSECESYGESWIVTRPALGPTPLFFYESGERKMKACVGVRCALIISRGVPRGRDGAALVDLRACF